MGWNLVQVRIFFGLLFQLLKLKAHCEDHKCYYCLFAVHIYDFHIFIFINIYYHRMYDKLTTVYLSICGLVAQWIEHCTGIARS